MIPNGLQPLETRKPEVYAMEYVLPNFKYQYCISAILMDENGPLVITHMDAIDEYLGGDRDAIEDTDDVLKIEVSNRKQLRDLIEDLQRLEASLPVAWGGSSHLPNYL